MKQYTGAQSSVRGTEYGGQHVFNLLDAFSLGGNLFCLHEPPTHDATPSPHELTSILS
jgi:hypothetical protein